MTFSVKVSVAKEDIFARSRKLFDRTEKRRLRKGAFFEMISGNVESKC